MAQVAGNKLIDVRFIDETNYPAATSDDDIVSVIVDTCWGPCERPIVCDSTTYQTLFNPQGLGWLNGTRATVSRVFGMGASFVEVLRLGKNEQWRFITGTVADGAVTMKVVSQAYGTTGVMIDDFSTVSELEGAVWAVRLRYAGGFPMQVKVEPAVTVSFAGHYLYNIVVSAYAGSVTKEVFGEIASVPVWRELESLQVTFDPLEVGGQSYFYADVISSRSAYLYCDTVWAYSQYQAQQTEEGESWVLPAMTSSILYPVQKKEDDDVTQPWYPSGVYTGGYVATDYENMYKFATSRNESRATIYVSSYTLSIAKGVGSGSITAAVNGITTVLQTMNSHVEGRMDCVSLAGFPTVVDKSYWGAGNDADAEETTRSNAWSWFKKVGNSGMNRFTGGVVGWELYTVSTIYGTGKFDLDCTAGWAGRICAVAKSLRNRNQLPSYKAYGSYSGALVRTLSFDSVVKLHEDYGIGSVYQSTAGNYIFDVRSLWGISESYFARLNVMRVCAALLGNTFDVVEGVIHTDAAANRDNRLRLESRLNSLMGEMISRKELRSQSYADVGDALNTDEATHGGRYLNINLVCWFIGLVERVNISVIATDSSVRAEITQVA